MPTEHAMNLYDKRGVGRGQVGSVLDRGVTLNAETMSRNLVASHSFMPT